MHLTADETYSLVAALIAVLGAAAAWLRASAAHKAAGRAETKANKALNGVGGGQAATPAPPPRSPGQP